MGAVRISEVNIDMLTDDGSYYASLYNVNAANYLSEVEGCQGDTIPEVLRGIADRIEAAALKEFDPRRRRPGT